MLVIRQQKKTKKKRLAVRMTLRLYLSMFQKYWFFSYPAILASAIGSTLIFYIPPLIIAKLIQQPAETTLANSWGDVLMIFVVWFTGEMLWRISLFFGIKLEIKVLRELYDRALVEIMKKEVKFFHNRFTGSITKNLLSHARRFEEFFDTVLFNVTAEILPAIFAAIILWTISPWLSIALLVMMFFGVIIIRPFIRKRMVLVKEREDAHAEMSGHISDVVSNITAVKSFGVEEEEQNIHRDYIDKFTRKASRSWHYGNVPIDMIIAPIYVLTNIIGIAIVLSLQTDTTTKANLFIGYSYFASVTRFLWSFNGVYRRIETAITDGSLFTEYLLEPPKVIDAPSAKTLNVSMGHLVFDNVSFAHADQKETLLDDFSLDITTGQRVGLVGPSGAGKTTVVNLILRFMDIQKGRILIDDNDITEVAQESLHKAISYVPQEPLLFHRSLRENIAYGKQDATDEEIIDASKQAYAWEFISKLPEGLDTIVGERGVKLSGGQRQRIAIARAILKNAPILVLDEATSALDSESEVLIQKSLNNLMRGRTSIVIAHRLSTISKLDRIVVMADGSIVEDGTHQELIDNNNMYARLWKHQSGGFIEE